MKDWGSEMQARNASQWGAALKIFLDCSLLIGVKSF